MRNRCGINAYARKPADSFFSQPQRRCRTLQHAVPQKRFIEQNTHFAGQVIVTTPRSSKGRIAGTRDQPHGAGAKGHPHQRFEQPRDVLIGQAKIAMPALLIDFDQRSIEQLG